MKIQFYKELDCLSVFPALIIGWGYNGNGFTFGWLMWSITVEFECKRK